MSAATKDVSKRKSSEVSRDRAELKATRKDAPNPVWFKPVMFGLMLLGLVWIVVFYVTAGSLRLPVPTLGQGNIFVGFGIILAGFFMTPWWK